MATIDQLFVAPRALPAVANPGNSPTTCALKGITRDLRRDLADSISLSIQFRINQRFLKNFLLLIALLLPASVTAQQNIVVVGDSLSAAHGMAQNEGWVHLLALHIEQQGLPYRVINASISGETTQGARTRFKGILENHQPTIVVIALGGNDGLRGLSLRSMKENLAFMIEKAKAHNAKVLLAGMQLPPNYGRIFTERFFASYRQLAEQHDVALLPFLLKGMERELTHYQPDGIHPLSSAQPIILDNVWPHLKPLLE